MITLQAVFRVTQTTPRRLLDNLQHIPDDPKSINIGVTNEGTLSVVLIGWFLFLLMTLDWPLSVLFWGVCRVRGRCLGGDLRCMSDSGYCLGWGGSGGGMM